MRFDIFTVMAASSAVVVVLGMTIFLMWSRDRQAYWLGWWSVGYLVLALGNGLIMARPSLPEIISASVGSSVVFTGFWLLWQSARVFEGRKIVIWPICLAIAVWLGWFFFGGIADSLGHRIMLASLPPAVFLWLGAFEFAYGEDELPSRKPLIAITIFLGGVFGLRVPLAFETPFPMGALPVDGLWVAGFNGILILAAIIATLLFISMTLERAELGQRELARVDPLTGLFNRRALQEVFDRDVERNTAVMLFDLDRFKLVNDIYGHAAGDALLQRFTRICQENIRQVDFAARMGGEEFLIVVHDIEEHGAYQIAERIRIGFANSLLETPRGEVGCTVSAGIEVTTQGGQDIEVLLQRADAKLYRAKRDGRNRICITPEYTAA